MENDLIEIKVSENFKHKLGKGVLGFMAGAIASGLVEKAYDAVLNRVRNRAA